MSGAVISVRVTPRSGRDEVGEWRDGELAVRVCAPPDGGKANAAVCALIAKQLRVPKSAVQVVRGETSRHKRIAIDGTDESEVRAKLGG